MSFVRKTSKVLGRSPYLIGKIDVPKSVKIETNGEQLAVSGVLGTVKTDLSKLDTKGSTALKIIPEQRQLAVACCDREFFGTIQTLIKNSINGVIRGYLRYLRIQGIGFRAALNGQTLTLKLGFSHDVAYELPPTLRAILPEPTLVGIYGIDKHLVMQAAANIRRLRPPSAYKGKGIRYTDEIVKLKQGKKK